VATAVAATGPASVKKCSFTANEPCVCKNLLHREKAEQQGDSSNVQAPLRGGRDQYSSIPRVFDETKTCATSSSSVSYSEGSSLDR
jgi:hypothetical protein